MTQTSPVLAYSRCDESSPIEPDCGGTAAEANAHISELYRKHSGSLVRQIAGSTGSRELAHDLAQEAFERLMRLRPGRVGKIDKPENYLRRIASNLVKGWGRDAVKADQAACALELETDQVVDQVALLECRDTLRLLEQVVSKMKPRTREIFLAHRVEGLSYAEIAARFAINVKGVEKQMSKAIAKIDRALNRG